MVGTGTPLCISNSFGSGLFARADDGKTSVDRAAPTLLNSPANPLVALRVVFRAGSQDDPPGKEGLAALTAAMVAEGGTRSLSYEQILEAFYPMAAMLGGECHKELTVFAGTIHRDNLAAYIPLVTDMITQPRFAAEDFERLRNEALDYITKTLRGNNDEELGKWGSRSRSTRIIPTVILTVGRPWV